MFFIFTIVFKNHPAPQSSFLPERFLSEEKYPAETGESREFQGCFVLYEDGLIEKGEFVERKHSAESESTHPSAEDVEDLQLHLTILGQSIPHLPRRVEGIGVALGKGEIIG